MITTQDAIQIRDFRLEPALADRLRAVAIVKGFAQLEQNSRYSRRLAEGGPLGAIVNRPYRLGMLLCLNGNDSVSDFFNYPSIFLTEPYCLAYYKSKVVIGSGNEIIYINLDTRTTSRISNIWFSHIHYIEFSKDGR